MADDLGAEKTRGHHEHPVAQNRQARGSVNERRVGPHPDERSNQLQKVARENWATIAWSIAFWPRSGWSWRMPPPAPPRRISRRKSVIVAERPPPRMSIVSWSRPFWLPHT